jgi:Bacterial DNA-binding protein
MTKQQLSERVAAKTQLPKAQVEVVVDSVIEVIAETLKSNGCGYFGTTVQVGYRRRWSCSMWNSQ